MDLFITVYCMHCYFYICQQIIVYTLSTFHILHISTTFFLCQYYKCINFKFLGCCCHPDMQVLVLVMAAIVNTLSPICVYTVVTMMLSYI